MSYFDEAAPAQIISDYPLASAFDQGVARMSVDERTALQSARFKKVIKRAWNVPFYARRWRAAGLQSGAIRQLEDLRHVPRFTKSDLMQSVAEHPPFGDFHGMDDLPGVARRQVIFHSTSGTTGDPQPLFFGAHDREVQNALLARAYRMQGLRDEDVVHSVYGFGLVNGGHYVREAIAHFTRALLITPGTGVDTPSERQVQMMARFGVTVLVGFADYLFRLAQVAREAGLEPGRDIHVRLISGHIPHERREELSQAWGGARVCDWYGVGDTGVIAAESEPGGGLWMFEDAQLVEIVDPDSGRILPDGDVGNQCVTCLFKDTVYPIVRFDTQDLSAVASAPADSAWTLRQSRGFLGRSDNMVKLRGINVYPTALGAHLAHLPQSNGEYICVLRRVEGQDALLVDVEWDEAPSAEHQAHVETQLRDRIGVRVSVNLVPPGATAMQTGLQSRQKPVRLVDERK